jgi:hypothetical protein
MIGVLDLHCLNAVCDDYENIDSVLADVRQATSSDTNRERIKECFSRLVAQGLVSTYDYDTSKGKYVELSKPPSIGDNNWFFITAKGRNALDKEWPDEGGM